MIVITKLFFLVLSGFTHKYFLRKRQIGAKLGERTNKKTNMTS